MDAIDRDILRHLQLDGRLTNAELARRIGLSPTPTLRRVRALETAGAIEGYRAVINPDAVDRAFRVLVWINLANGPSDARAAVEAFETALSGIDEVVEAHRLYGDPDYLLRVAVADSAAYETLYMTKLAALPGVDKACSQMAMKTVKDGTVVPL